MKPKRFPVTLLEIGWLDADMARPVRFRDPAVPIPLISAARTRNARHLHDTRLQGDLVPLHDDRILAEYRAVLSRARFDFAPEDVSAVLEGIEGGGETVFAKPLPLELPDPDDFPFLEVAVAGRADALVTGNLRHYQPVRGRHGVEIVSPNGLVKRLARS